ncbi:hypothetical protein JD969_04225 [Planctomycetota bacterium]|nr:hypothetical protein JD969_04225 [Planctomycetota bacterium]
MKNAALLGLCILFSMLAINYFVSLFKIPAPVNPPHEQFVIGHYIGHGICIVTAMLVTSIAAVICGIFFYKSVRNPNDDNHLR